MADHQQTCRECGQQFPHDPDRDICETCAPGPLDVRAGDYVQPDPDEPQRLRAQLARLDRIAAYNPRAVAATIARLRARLDLIEQP